MRWLSWALGGAFCLWLFAMVRREALRRGRRGLAVALPFVAGALITFPLSILAANPTLSKVFVLLAFLQLVGAIAVLLWKGFH